MGGCGMAAAWGGIRFLDEEGEPIPLSGQGLGLLSRIDMSGKDKRLDQCQILVASDVDNPLYGAQGAAHVLPGKRRRFGNGAPLGSKFAPLQSRARGAVGGRLLRSPPRRGRGRGGLGTAFLAFSPAQIKSGISVILEQVRFEQSVEDADLIITGEGKLDGQTLHGKVPFGVAQRARKKRDSGYSHCGRCGCWCREDVRSRH